VNPRVAVDVHTHLGLRGVHVHDPLAADEERTTARNAWNVDIGDLTAAETKAEKAIVLAFDAEPVGVVVPNEFVADAVRGNDKLIGFASVNPTRVDATDRLINAVENLGLRGLKLGPTYQHFHPQEPASYELLEVAEHYKLPVIWHQGTTFTRAARADFSRPLDLDAVAGRFPDVPMWIAHFGHPWMAEAVSVIRRHPRMYIDCSAMDKRPWQLAQSLAAAYEYGVIDRVLFGTDFPFSTVDATIAGLRKAAELCWRLGIADLPEDVVERICDRDALSLLGLTGPQPPSQPERQNS
jgi:predicted TIM-barrel fold metal-dependent hydrolase